MQLSSLATVLLVLGLTLSGCTTSSSPPPQSPELEISNPLGEYLGKEVEK